MSTDLMDLTARLDRQADAIRMLTRRVADLEKRLSGPVTDGGDAGPVSDRSDTGAGVPDMSGKALDWNKVWTQAEIRPVLPLIQTGTWVRRGACLTCGSKHGRKTMTCSQCSAARTAALHTPGSHRPEIPRCLNCGAGKAASGLTYLCLPCRAAAKAGA